jgi:prepilin-type N-terminal cleavage/methylation domain-containing protein
MGYLNLKNKNKGFTLVELMVAIAVFSIVMVTAMSALLNVIDANNKARSIKSAINNISFALEGISKDMRMGTEYSCSEDSDPLIFSDDCLDGGKAIRFKSSKASNTYVYYKFVIVPVGDKTVGQIQSCVESGDTPLNCNNYSAITSTEVDLKNVVFYVLNTEDDEKQPRMIMTLSGEAGTKEKIKTAFDLQTGVSQRIRK